MICEFVIGLLAICQDLKEQVLVDPLAGVETNSKLVNWLTGLLVCWLTGLLVAGLLVLLVNWSTGYLVTGRLAACKDLPRTSNNQLM